MSRFHKRKPSVGSCQTCNQSAFMSLKSTKTVRIRMTVRAMRTVDKVGLMPYLKKNGMSLKDVTS